MRLRKALMIKRWTYGLFILLATLQGNYCDAQVYNFQTFNVEDGLSQSQVNCIYEDSRGFLWLATYGGGVCRFDGVNFVSYEEKEGLAGPIVTSISEDKSGNLWFGSTWGGLTRFNGREFKAYEKNDGLIDNGIHSLIYNNTGEELLIGTAFGLSVFKNEKFNNITFPGLKQNLVADICDAGNGKYLLATEFGLFSYQNGVITEMPTSMGSRSVSSVTVDKDGSVWAVAESQLFHFVKKVSSDSYVNQPHFASDSTKYFLPFHTVYCSPSGGLWVSLDNEAGVYHITDNKTEYFGEHNGFPFAAAISIYEDKSGCTWFGTSGNGLIKFNGKTFVSFLNSTGFKEPDIFSIALDSSGRVWASSFNKGVFYSDETGYHKFEPTVSIPLEQVRSIYVDSKKNIWMASVNGLFVYDGVNTKVFTIDNGLPTNAVKSVYEDKKGNIWIGTYGSGLCMYDGKTFTNYREDEGLSHGHVHAIIEDQSGVIWIGTGSGVFKFKDGKFTNYSEGEGLCNSYAGSLAEDKFGNIWIGTDKCVSKFNGRKFSNLTVEDGLNSGVVYLLTIDKDGSLIVGTNKGINKIEFSPYGQITAIKKYGKSEGFTGIECNSRAVMNDNDGNIWIGTVKGIIRYNTKEEREIKTSPEIHITGFKLWFEKFDESELSGANLNWFGVPENITLRHDQNNITFDYVGLNLDIPSKIEYSYMLEGFDPNWSPPTKNTSVSYSNLAPNTYTFKVKARMENGQWGDEIATVSFTIRPAFWQTWWFFLIILMTLVYIAWYYSRLMQKNAARYNSLLEQKVTQRTQEILKQKEEKEILLQEIHHRVKNNMQVIVSLLNIHSDYIKDPESQLLLQDSKNRIKSMALIHEKLYESKNFTKVNIGEYLDKLVNDLIDTYGVNIKIKVEKEIESDSFGFDTIIPLGLLINEVISNSLKYAFNDREEGKIIFKLKKEGEYFILVIGDDGIGIPKEKFENNTDTLGMELIKILTEQLNGTIELMGVKGTVYRIKFMSIDKRRI
ncbi:MAG: ligand-binding sensor domain-containing protein [Bacteroidota bacterium]